MPETPTVPVTFDLAPEMAAALHDPAVRVRLERIMRRMLRPAGIQQLFSAMDALSDEARRRGLADDLLVEELADYNAHNRSS